LQGFCRSTSEFVISRVLLQKLCKSCPRPEKPFSNSKTISIYITYKNKLFKNQNWLKTEFWKIDKLTEMKNSSNHRVVIQKNPLQVTSDHFRMTTLSFDEFFNAHSYFMFLSEHWNICLVLISKMSLSVITVKLFLY